MKHFFLVVSALVVATVSSVAILSCNKDDSKGKLDPSAKVYINAAPSVASVASGVVLDSRADAGKGQVRLSAREVVKQAKAMDAIGYTDEPTKKWDMGVADWNRDTVNNRIAMSTSCVINGWGKLSPRFMGAIDLILVTLDRDNRNVDTIAYFDNREMRAAEAKIKAAFADKDYAACYKLFETAFVFRPITGAEYLELQAQNKQ